MPDLLCCYTFSSLPQEWKVRNSLAQRSKRILPFALAHVCSAAQCPMSNMPFSYPLVGNLLGEQKGEEKLPRPSQTSKLQDMQKSSYPLGQYSSALCSLLQPSPSSFSLNISVTCSVAPLSESCWGQCSFPDFFLNLAYPLSFPPSNKYSGIIH